MGILPFWPNVSTTHLIRIPRWCFEFLKMTKCSLIVVKILIILDRLKQHPAHRPPHLGPTPDRAPYMRRACQQVFSSRSQNAENLRWCRRAEVWQPARRLGPLFSPFFPRAALMRRRGHASRGVVCVVSTAGVVERIGENSSAR